MAEADCPNCDEVVRFSSPPKLGQRVTCPFCQEALEVVELKPLELDYVYEDEEYEDYVEYEDEDGDDDVDDDFDDEEDEEY